MIPLWLFFGRVGGLLKRFGGEFIGKVEVWLFVESSFYSGQRTARI